MRLTIVTNIPAPYRLPLYAEIHQTLAEDGGGLTVIYGGHHARGRQWSPSASKDGAWHSIYLPHAQLRIGDRTTYVNPLVAREVAHSRPDVTIIGGYAPWTYAAAAWCRWRSVPYLLWSGETPANAERAGTPAWRRRPLIRRAAGALAYGPPARDYLLELGVPEATITVVGNGIDIEAFRARVAGARSAPERDGRDPAAGPTLLSVGGKGIDVVLDALEAVDPRSRLVVVGTDEERVEAHATFLGRLTHDGMPGLYASADCLVHTPVLDLWPHAINEALSAGIPVVASAHTGVPDSILAGPGCAIVDPQDPAALTAALRSAISIGATATPEVREAITAPLREWGVARMADRMVAAARSVWP